MRAHKNNFHDIPNIRKKKTWMDIKDYVRTLSWKFQIFQCFDQRFWHDTPLNCLKLEKERGKLAHCLYRVGNWAKSRGSCNSGESGMLPSGTKTNFSAKVEQNDVWIPGVIRNFLYFNVPLTPFIITYNLYNCNTKKMNRNQWKVIRLFRWYIRRKEK